MARYIDAEALTDHMLEHYNDLCEKYGDYDHYTTGYGDAIDAIENAPTADVVLKTEVAREIFEEIEKRLSSMKYNANTPRKTVKVEELKEQVDWVLHEVVPNTIAELKKKYTEGEE